MRQNLDLIQRFHSFKSFLEKIEVPYDPDSISLSEQINPPITISSDALRRIEEHGMEMSVIQKIVELMEGLNYGDVLQRLNYIPSPIIIKEDGVHHGHSTILNNMGYGNCHELSRTLAARIFTFINKEELQGLQILQSEIKNPEFPGGGHWVLNLGNHVVGEDTSIIDMKSILFDPSLRKIYTLMDKGIRLDQKSKDVRTRIRMELTQSYDIGEIFRNENRSWNMDEVPLANLIGTNIDRQLFLGLTYAWFNNKTGNKLLIPVLEIQKNRLTYTNLVSDDSNIDTIWTNTRAFIAPEEGNVCCYSPGMRSLSKIHLFEIYEILKKLNSFSYETHSSGGSEFDGLEYGVD
jgi:hypothetical protein